MTTNELHINQAPHNLEAEQGIIGGILLDPDRFSEIEDRLIRADFFSPAFGEVYDAIATLRKKGLPLDIITLKEELVARDKLESVGGLAGLAALTDAVPSSAHVEMYATIVREKAQLRELISAASTIVRDASSTGVDAKQVIEQAEQTVYQISSRGGGGKIDRVGDLLDVLMERMRKEGGGAGGITGIPMDYPELDTMLSGLQPQDLIIVAGRPSMGKTTFALNVARRVALRAKKAVLIFSLEMSAINLTQNLVIAEGGLDAQRVRTGRLSKEELSGSFRRALEKLNNAPIFIDETPGISITEMRARTRRLKSRHNIELVLVDYLQLMSPPISANRSRSRENEIAEISRGLKAMAKELNIPVIALSQLSRKAEERKDNVPQLSDLRESGAIEQDADVVLLLHRPDYYTNGERPGEADVIVAKQRNGATGKVSLQFLGNQFRFEPQAGPSAYNQ